MSGARAAPAAAMNRRTQALDGDRQTDPPASARQPPASGHSGRLPAIDTRACTGCGGCVAVCEPHLLSLEPVGWKKFARLHGPQRCTGCSACAATCLFHAITMRKPAHAGAPRRGAPR